jgi:hypothetical protein
MRAWQRGMMEYRNIDELVTTLFLPRGHEEREEKI